MIETLNTVLIMAGISCLMLIWIAAVVGMMQIGWQAIASPLKELKGKEKDAT